MTSQHATIVCTRYTDWLTPEAAKIGVTVTPLAPQEFSVTRADGADLDPNIRVSTNSRFYTGHPVVMRTVSAKEARFLFPDDLVSGDYVEIWFEGFVAKATTTAQGVAVTSLTTPAPPAQTQSPTTPGDRRLVVWEGNTANPDHGRFFALQPGQASGIALPTFRVGASRPPVGTVEGESFYETTTQRGFVWDGSTWRDVTPSAILRYPNDAALVADQTQGVGAYGVSGTTGNLYVYTTTGWKPIGTQEYPTVAGLLADTPAIGTLAIAMDEGSEWEYLSTGWNCTSLRHLPTTADVMAWTDPANSHVGDRALAADKEVQYVRTSGGWKPASPYEEAEAVIRADVSWPLNGQEAISTDTGQIFVFVGGQWMEDPIQHYPTEQDLLAATPPVGTVAFADDNGLFYGRISGGWRRANSPTSSVGAHPANPADGDLNFRPNSGLQVYAGSSWQPVGGTPPGTIIMFPSWTSPPGYILCDGRAIPASATKAIALVGAHTPDLRGQFIRGSNSTQDTKGLTRHEDTTRRPRHHAFTGSTNWAGIHWHTLFKLRWHGLNDGGGYSDLEYQNSNNSDQDSAAPRTNNSGNHVHTVTVTGGGDSETAPVHVKLAFHMKL